MMSGIKNQNGIYKQQKYEPTHLKFHDCKYASISYKMMRTLFLWGYCFAKIYEKRQ